MEIFYQLDFSANLIAKSYGQWAFYQVGKYKIEIITQYQKQN